ncbi:MAG: hypothetical protein ACHQPI_14205 [Thermoanaerobaculia bacterium]
MLDWLEGRFESASQAWLAAATLISAGKVVYTDASGGTEAGSLLAFAAARLSRPALWDAAHTLFTYIVAKGRPASWPGPIAQFYLGAMPAGTLPSYASATPLLRERQLCQAHFAIAVMALHAGNESSYFASLTSAAGLATALVENELHLARYELAARGV